MMKQKNTPKQHQLTVNQIYAPFEKNQSEALYGLGTTKLCRTENGEKYIAINGEDSDDIEQSLVNAFVLLSDKVTISVHTQSGMSTYYLQSEKLDAVKNDLSTLHSLVGHESELGFTTMFCDNQDSIGEHPGLKGKSFTLKPVSIDKKYIEQLSDTSSQEISCSFNYLCIPHGAKLEGKDQVEGWEVTINSSNQDIRTALAENQEPDSYHDLMQHGKPLEYKRIVQDGKNGIMSSSGDIILDYQYDCMPGNVDSLGHILVRNGSKRGMLRLDTQSNTCKEVVSCSYDTITRFKYQDEQGNLYAQATTGSNFRFIDVNYKIHSIETIKLKEANTIS